uniref:Uncharacterized protein n=1 Tax=Glossina morsitans morsitans TaxID=37546 RepID=A0A1B0GDS0_GLOMM
MHNALLGVSRHIEPGQCEHQYDFRFISQFYWHNGELIKIELMHNAEQLINRDHCMNINLLYPEQKQFSCYLDLMHLFHETTFITTCGQRLDMLNSNKSVSTFTMDTYNTIAANKTSHYTFYLPIAAAMHLAGLKNAEALRQIKIIAMKGKMISWIVSVNQKSPVNWALTYKMINVPAVLWMQRANIDHECLEGSLKNSTQLEKKEKSSPWPMSSAHKHRLEEY